MAKLNTPKGKLVRKLGVNIFGNPKFDKLYQEKDTDLANMDNLESVLRHILRNYRKNRKSSLCMVC